MVRHGVEISRIGGSRVVLQDEFVRSCNRRRERSWRMMGERKKDVDPEHFREMGILGGPRAQACPALLFARLSRIFHQTTAQPVMHLVPCANGKEKIRL